MRTYADMTFEEVMEAFADTVTRLAYLRMGNEQDAKDIFQNVFLKLIYTDNGISRFSACEGLADSNNDSCVCR